MRGTTFSAALLGFSVLGCAGRATAPPPSAPRAAALIAPVDDARFREGLAAMTRHDRASDWDAGSCRDTVELLLAAKASAAARYDAGLVELRCKHDARAKDQLEAALAIDPSFQKARTALATLHADGPRGLDAAIEELGANVHATRFGDADALVALAALQARRGNTTSDEEGADDAERARKNLQRALAIDDANMPAMNQLALLHLARAKAAGRGKDDKRGATMALEMAAFVCTQAIAKNPRYAPVHNTLGLVEMEANNLSRAAAAFDDARKLDPRLVEAHMNLGALNLQVRGFSRAEEAYRAALAERPNDYDAHLGLALALRGQIDPNAFEAGLEAARREIAAAERVAPERPEAYFNEAILEQEYGSRLDTDGSGRSIARALELLERFLAMSEGMPALATERERAKQRLHDLHDALDYVKTPWQKP